MKIHANFATVALLATLLLAACSTDVDVASRSDAGHRTDSYDECGNGMDDDADGQIDEGCPCGAGELQSCFAGTYPHRLIGVCRDGLQQCGAGEGAEFGRWQGCEGGALPGTETCEGVFDEDCDGAIDEGCACENAEPRDCARAFETGPCQPGRQACVEGLWSACVGAIGPSAELCSDDIDNDCDGQVNEGCECLPEPERCGDSIDNDCDGVVDEPSSCSPVETCGDGVDNNRNGLIDETCACECEASEVVYNRTFVTDEVWPSSRPEGFSWDIWNASTSVWTGQETAFVIVGLPAIEGDTALAIYLDRYDNAGNRLGMTRVSTGDVEVNLSSQLLWTGQHYVLASSGFAWLLSERGESLGDAIAFEGHLHWNGREVGRVWSERAPGSDPALPVDEVFFRTYDAQLNPLLPTLKVSPAQSGYTFSVTDLSSIGDRWLVGALHREVHAPGSFGRPDGFVWVISGQTVVARNSLGGARYVQLAMGPDGALAFYSRPVFTEPSTVFWEGTGHYRRLDLNGALTGVEELVPDPGARRGFAATYWNCGYLIVSPGFAAPRGVPPLVVLHVDQEGHQTSMPLPEEVVSGAVDGEWYFFNAFNEMPRSAGNLIFAGRDRGGEGRGARSGYARIMMSCP